MEGIEVKTFVGYGYGQFETDQRKMQDYCNVFLLAPFVGEQNPDYHFGGDKAEKLKCASPAVFRDIPIGSKVNVFCDSKGKVTYNLLVNSCLSLL